MGMILSFSLYEQEGIMEYRKKHAIMRREAAMTLAAAVVVMAFWWIAGFGLQDADFTILFMPGWFVVSCLGSWILSIAAVCLLVKRFFTVFSLEDDEKDDTKEDDAK
jgi:uncharacterized membrane protein YhdT